jgi:hypothetical protein
MKKRAEKAWTSEYRNAKIALMDIRIPDVMFLNAKLSIYDKMPLIYRHRRLDNNSVFTLGLLQKEFKTIH